MENKWDLRFIYPNEAAFNADLTAAKEELIPSMASYHGKLGNEKDFVAFLLLQREAQKCFTKLYLYSGCASDLNKKDVAGNERLNKVELLSQDYAEKLAWSDPEFLGLGLDKIKGILSRHPEVKEFDYSFEKLYLDQTHILSADKERLLSSFGPLLEEGSKLYSMLSVGDYTPKKAKLKDGKEVEVSTSNWTNLIAETKDPEDRQTIFETLYAYYDEHKNVYAEIYNNDVQAELSEMKARGYSSILEEHLFHNRIPTSVFLNLVDVASHNAKPLHEYYKIRAQYLGLEKHRSYDRFLQLAHSTKKYSYDEAKSLFFDSIKPFPEDFQKKARTVLEDGYVDVYPSLGKRSGAYSNGGYQDGKDFIHPVILFNFQGELDDCFTVAHESGHSIHTLYAMESQPLMKQDYTIFTAEIASTFNEHNLLDYLLTKGSLDRESKIALLQKAIDEIVSTFYRQTLFAQYEYDISKKAEAGEPLSYQVLNDEMTKLYETYYGIDIREEKLKPFVWAYIPHLFYTPFYVYQYATSFTASMLLYENVKAKKPHAFERYVGLLKSGGSTFPIDEVLSAGVDLTSKAPFMAVVERMQMLVDELKKTLEER
ncbi:MAG: oligoendopeptidase F [Bacilli bacterium]